MSNRWDKLFEPDHVLVVGASERPYSLGEEVMTALTGAPFAGKITPINPKHKHIGGSDAYRSIAAVPDAADVAVLLSPAETYEAVMRGCIRKKIPHVVVLLPQAEPLEEDLPHLHKISDLARWHDVRITVCTPSGLYVPSAGWSVSRYRYPKHSGSIGVLGMQGEFVAETLYRLRDLPFGIGKAVNLLPLAGATQADEVVDCWADDRRLKTLVVQYAPQVCTPQKLFSALRHAARNQTVILHHTQSLRVEERAMVQRFTDDCGIINTFTPEDLLHTLYAVHLFKGSETGRVYFVGNTQSDWLDDAAQQAGVAAVRLPESRLPESCGMQMLCRAIDTAWRQDDCYAVLLDVPAPMAGQVFDISSLAESYAAQKRPLLFVSPDASGRYGFKQSQAALQVLAARSRMAAVKKQMLSVMPPRIQPRAHIGKKPLINHFSAAQIVKKLPLPPLAEGQGAVALRYAVHAHFGAYLFVMLPESPQAFLPPFHSGHAQRLAQCFPEVVLVDWEALLDALNRAAYDVPAVGRIEIAVEGAELRTVGVDVNPTAKAVAPLWEEPPLRLAHHFGKKGGVAFAVRSLEASDAAALQHFVRVLSPQARKTRFMMGGKELSPQLLSRFTRLDYRREAAFVAEVDGAVVAHAQYGCSAFPERCEFGISVSEDYRGNGLAFHLMKQLIDTAERQGYLNMYATILADNIPMLKLAEKLGLKLEPVAGERNLMSANLTLHGGGKIHAWRIAKQILAQKG